MKLVIFSSTESAQEPRLFHKIARSAAATGYEVVIIARHPGRIVQENIRIEGLPAPRNRLGRMLCTTWAAFFCALRERGDVYQFSDPELIPLGLLLQFLARRPVVYDLREYHAERIRNKFWLPRRIRGPVAFLYEWVENTFLRHFAGVVTVNDHLASRLRTRGCRMVVVMPNYPPKVLFEPPPFLTHVAQTYDENEVLIYVGGLSESRGITQAIRVMKRLCKEFPNAKLLLAGRFESALYQQEVMQLIDRLDLADNVDILGVLPHPEVIRYLAIADVGIFLLQPVSERYNWGEPIKYFEYSAFGLPVIISDLLAKRRLIEKNQNGILVDPLDEEKIAESIASLLRDPQRMKEMGKRGRDAFLKEYNWEAIEGRLIDLYERLTGES